MGQSETGVGLQVSIDDKGLQAAIDRLNVLVSFSGLALLEGIGALGESQTRRRISDEETAPDGTPWPANSGGTPILLHSGQNLLASIAHAANGETAEWDASWEFAHIHQDGAIVTAHTAKALRFTIGGRTVHAKGVAIPARPFLGLSDANRVELDELITDHFGRIIQR